jgi:lysophospholipase L1-like esterase
VTLVQGVIPRIEQVSNDMDLRIIDVYSALVNHPEDYLSDGVHPNIQGVKAIAYEIYRFISTSTHQS